MKRLLSLSLLLLTFLTPPGFAEPARTNLGGDLFIGGSGTIRGLDAQRDVFIGGNAITLNGQVAQDIHAAGFNVDVEAEASGDVYAAGATVTIRADIGEDLSAAGFAVRTAPTSTVAGNARLAGGTVTIDGAIDGALVAAGAEVILNAPITGDAWITAETLTFGPAAVVSGNLRYSTPDEISVPERVASPDRVTYQELDRDRMIRNAREAWERREYPVLPTFLSIFAGFIITLAFFIVLGALFLAFAPMLVQRLRKETLAEPGVTLLLGVIGLAVLFGLVPISAMTVIGLPFVPIIVLAIIVAWTLGYVLGAYVVAMRFWQSFSNAGDPSLPVKLVALSIGVIFVTLLNFIPFVGWLANFALVLLGIGAITRDLFARVTGHREETRETGMTPTPDGS